MDKTRRITDSTSDENSKTILMPTSETISKQRNTNIVQQAAFIGGGLYKDENIRGYIVEEKFSNTTGEAEIYLANKNGKNAIIKYYYPNFKAKEEILKNLLNLNHENIIDIFEYGIHKGRFFEIQDYAAGGTLGDKLTNGDYKYLPLCESKVMDVIYETIDAFKYCHGKGIIHRDIKPDNIFYKNADGSDILIGDFGISTALDIEGGMSKKMTTTSRTEGFAAPELYSGIIGKEVDYYALGITLFIIMTGTDPFAERNLMHVMRDTIEGRILDDLLSRPEAKKINDKFKNIIKGLLVIRHDKRWGYNEIVRYLNGESVEIFYESQKQKLRAFKFSDEQTVNSFSEMAMAITYDRDSGRKYLYRGMIEDWVKDEDQSLALKIGDLRETYGSKNSQDYGLERLRYLLSPGLPLVLDDRSEIKNFSDFDLALKDKPQEMVKLLRDETSRLHAWMFENEFIEYSKSIIELSKEIKNDKRFINIIRLSNYGDNFRPFEDNGYRDVIITSIDQLWDLPDNLRKFLLSYMNDRDSIFVMWLEKNSSFEKINRWFSGVVNNNWQNFKNIFSNQPITSLNLDYNQLKELTGKGDNEARIELEKINKEKATEAQRLWEIEQRKLNLKSKLKKGVNKFFSYGLKFGILGIIIGGITGCVGSAKVVASYLIENAVTVGLYLAMFGASLGFFIGFYKK